MLCKKLKNTFTQSLINLLIICLSLFFVNAAEAGNLINIEKHGSGKPIILIPGLMSDASVWQSTIDTLKSDYELHVVSIAGFGKTQPQKNNSVKRVAEQLSAYIVNHNLNRPAIVGHSLGGFMSYYMAIHHPKQVGKIISVDGLPYIAPIFTRNPSTKVVDMAPSAKRMQAQYAQMTPAQMAFVTQSSINIQATSQQSQEKVLKMTATSDPTTVGNFMYELMTTDLRDAIQTIDKPILLLGASGGFSQESEHQFAESLYRQQFEGNDNAKIVMNKNSRHFIMFDQPTWLIEQLTTFIGK